MKNTASLSPDAVPPVRTGALARAIGTYAKRAFSPVLVLLGHTDVVPPGPLDAWTSDPFIPTVRDGVLYRPEPDA